MEIPQGGSVQCLQFELELGMLVFDKLWHEEKLSSLKKPSDEEDKNPHHPLLLKLANKETNFLTLTDIQPSNNLQL